ncbi:ClpXP protease specificity-enhancing factor SspB [Rickettsiales endosymbiont of Peranema trichophorum]|uniref:ClpXP protease specificity-enhancing factor SspB n=1 Tax=Rickettsiales endosymbiont of Peranema trichophorum TaxID=2486577 RepID=UPI001A90E207|nr:ClpXP protease specificity-enhancing factor SspB [Rickettsiales endosymbiont of Peranema trichophorum]
MMDSEFINYGRLVDASMHSIVFKVLKLVELEGLRGEHHFLISFMTQYEGVIVPEVVIEKYPEEITVVIQHQYQNLRVGSQGFGVTLSFAGKKGDIYVPYAAITSFADPSVQFGLQFRGSQYHPGFTSIVAEHNGNNNTGHKKVRSSIGQTISKTHKRSECAEDHNVVPFTRFQKKLR